MTTLAFRSRRTSAPAVDAPAPVPDPQVTAEPVRMATLAEGWRALGRIPPDVNWHASLACPVCYGDLERGAAGWVCGPCGVGWDWRGTHGRWLPLTGRRVD